MQNIIDHLASNIWQVIKSLDLSSSAKCFSYRRLLSWFGASSSSQELPLGFPTTPEGKVSWTKPKAMTWRPPAEAPQNLRSVIQPKTQSIQVLKSVRVKVSTCLSSEAMRKPSKASQQPRILIISMYIIFPAE